MSTRAELTRLLGELAESLDITETQYEEVERRYQAVGDWLDKSDSAIARHAPAIYPQGSIRLGTIVKPIGRDGYDIDLVCELQNLRRDNLTQAQLKQLVGDRLKEHETYRKMLREGSRCWTLNYAESTKFHMDILPAIPDHDIVGLRSVIGAGLAEDTILIPDKELGAWCRSNPKGYAVWFYAQMASEQERLRKSIAASLQANVEDVPDFKIRTTLQRAVQILKRHRDIMFADDPDDKPISIIISTLAAHAYQNQADLLEALETIVRDMPNHIENRNGVSWVPNPVNPDENFADKWETHPQREANFRRWLQRVESDFARAVTRTSTEGLVEDLSKPFGEQAVERTAAAAFGAGAARAPHVQIENPSRPWGA